MRRAEPAAGGAAGESGAAALPRLSSRFGYRAHPILGRRALHAGIDIPADHGTPVQASETGMVTFAGVRGGYGKMVEIDHGQGLRTRYAHLSRIAVGGGTPIARGQIVGLIGSTGRSTGNHLHFEVRVHGRAVDPLGYIGIGGTGRAAGGSSYVFAQAAAPEAPHLSAYARARMEAGQAGGSGL
ncbi:M23 family metallopeptidase [Caenibius sp. WL]|nr:M23 family metallopeptidase [Caenibius sp. WL]